MQEESIRNTFLTDFQRTDARIESVDQIQAVPFPGDL